MFVQQLPPKPFKLNANGKCFIKENFKSIMIDYCRNPSLGFVTKARGCKVAGQEKDPKVISHAPRSVNNVRE